jgi:hypothetical protein
MAHQYFSQRTGVNPHPNGLSLVDVVSLFVRVYDRLVEDGYFTEAFGFICVDAGVIPGKVRDPALELLLAVRKKNLWPIPSMASKYSEDDFFDLLEYLYKKVSKPTRGTPHDYNDCGMHWERFDASQGRLLYRQRVNEVLGQYERRFALSVKVSVS